MRTLILLASAAADVQFHLLDGFDRGCATAHEHDDLELDYGAAASNTHRGRVAVAAVVVIPPRSRTARPGCRRMRRTPSPPTRTSRPSSPRRSRSLPRGYSR